MPDLGQAVGVVPVRRVGRGAICNKMKRLAPLLVQVNANGNP